MAKFEPDSYWGLGNDAYVGALHFFHQVHCLNLLRKAAFAIYGRESSWYHLKRDGGHGMSSHVHEHIDINAQSGEKLG